MKISQSILLSFLVVLVLFSVLAFINYRQSALILENVNQFDRSASIVRYSNRFQRNFLSMVSGLRGYLTTSEESFIQTYDSSLWENNEILTELKTFVPEGSEQRTILDDIRELHRYWIDEFALPLLEAKKTAGNSDDDNRAFHEMYRKKLVTELEKDVQRSLQRKFSAFTNYENERRAADRENLMIYVQKTGDLSVYLTLFLLVAGGVFLVFVIRHITSRLSNATNMAMAIAEGVYEVRVPQDGNNELSRLAAILNQMAGALQIKISSLKRRNEDLEQFAYTVSHELKAPLRGIGNVAGWITEDNQTMLAPDTQAYLTMIRNKVSRAENILKAIFIYTRSGHEELTKEIVDVGILLGEIRDDMPSTPNITFIIQPNMPVLYTERVPLLQVFTNLITNAFKYHDKRGGFVKVYWEVQGNYYSFSVEDNGPGINSRHHHRIFNAFETLQGADAAESMGIGLAIVKKILDDRDLTIRVVSEPGLGATFTFTWPKNEL